MALTKITSKVLADDAVSTASLADGIIQAAHLHSSHGITTSNIAEGSNEYHTTARARTAVSVSGSLAYNSSTGVVSFTQRTDAASRGLISVTDSGGDGSLAYNNSTGVITYTGPSASEVRAHISAGSGITVSSGAISIANDAIDSQHYAAGSIDLEHMSANSIDSTQYVDGSIDLAHMSNNSIDSDQYVDGSIDTAHIAASQITNALMADNAIDSAEIVAGSIDTAHIADDQVTAAKLANTAVTAASYGSSTAVPVVTIDAQGRITGASTAAISSSLTVGADSGTDDVVTVGTDTLDFVGTSNQISTTVSNNQIQIGFPTDVTISGDLTVSGDTTTVNTATLAVEDPLVSLATGNNAADAVDIGIYGLYDTSGSQDLYGGIFRDASDSGKWKLFKDNQAAPTTTVNTSGTGYAVGSLVANLEGNVTGNVTGNVSGNTSGTAATVTGATQAAITTTANLVTVGTIGTGVWQGTAIATGYIAADAIDGTKIADNAIDSEHYTDASIDLAHMSANSIDSTQYVDGSIDLVHMSANSVDSAQYVDGSIDTAHIAADQITSALIADDQIDSEHIVDGSIDLAHMSVNSIDSTQYVDGSIDLAHMSVNSIDSDQYVDGSIDTAHLADDAVTSAKLDTNIAIGGTLGVTGAVTVGGGSGTVTGNLTGNVSGNATTATTVVGSVQSNIASLGTLTSLTGGTGDLIWDTPTFVVDSSTNRVGIGTTTPGDLLHVTNGDSAVDTRIRLQAFGQLPIFSTLYAGGTESSPTVPTSGTDLMRLAVNTWDGTDYSQMAGSIRFTAEANHADNSAPTYMSFWTNPTQRLETEKMRIDSTGNLLLGMTAGHHEASGRTVFEMKGTSSAVIGMDIGGSLSTYMYDSGTSGTLEINHPNEIYLNADSKLRFATGTNVEAMTIMSDGDVGIGTTAPSQKLHIFQTEGSVGAKHAAIQFGGYAAYKDRGPMIAAYRVDGNSNNQGLIFSTYHVSNAVVDTLTMTNDGRVGINDTSPSYTLDVDGDINFTGTLREDGTEFSGGIGIGKAIAMAIVFG